MRKAKVVEGVCQVQRNLVLKSCNHKSLRLLALDLSKSANRRFFISNEQMMMLQNLKKLNSILELFLLTPSFFSLFCYFCYLLLLFFFFFASIVLLCLIFEYVKKEEHSSPSSQQKINNKNTKPQNDWNNEKKRDKT